MRPPLVRFGVALDAPLLADLDKLVAARGCTRSEMFRDLARAEVVRAKVRAGVDAVGALTIVYDHHVRDLSEKLTDLQHQLGDGVRSALHVHLSHAYCLEVIVIRGKSDRLRAIADKILAMRGVKHGGIEIVAAADLKDSLARPHPRPPRATPAVRAHRHGHQHAHEHSHVPRSDDGPKKTPGRPSRARATARATRNGAPSKRMPPPPTPGRR